jgi:hypothetical protein
VKKSASINLALAIIGIMIFREMFKLSQANLIIADTITQLPFSPIILIVAIPLILGVITGYNYGAITLSYFLVEPLFKFSNMNIVGVSSLIFIGSLVGYLVSPIHLCNVVSSDHFKTDTTRMYKMYIPSAIMVLAVQIPFLILFYSI